MEKNCISIEHPTRRTTDISAICERQGNVVSSEELFEAVWGEKYFNNNNTVMAHIGRLREKLGEPAKKPKFIKTVWGVGYTIEK